MPFSLRSYRRVPVCCPVTYQVGGFEGHGMDMELLHDRLASVVGSSDESRGNQENHFKGVEEGV